MKLQRKFTKNVHDTGEVKNRVETAEETSKATNEKAQKVDLNNFVRKILN
jgi:hypothetical protein